MTVLKVETKACKARAGVEDSSDEEEAAARKEKKGDASDEDPVLAGYRDRRTMASMHGKKVDIGKFLHDDGESRRRRSLKQIEQWKKAAMKNTLLRINAVAHIKCEDEQMIQEC